jgi:hypothetical protein
MMSLPETGGVSGRVGVSPAERRILRRGLPDGGGRIRTPGSPPRRDARTGGQDAHPTRNPPSPQWRLYDF